MIIAPATSMLRMIYRLLSRSLFLFFMIACFLPLAAQVDGLNREEAPPAFSLQEGTYTLSLPKVMQSGKEARAYLTIKQAPADLTEIQIEVDGEQMIVSLSEGKGGFSFVPTQDQKELTFISGTYEKKIEIPVVNFPPWMSILPPLMAIILALIFREVVVSLFLGIFAGSAVLAFYAGGGIKGVLSGFLTVIDTYVINALMDQGHLSIILFSLLIGGMVGVISKNGGMQGVVNRISKIATTAKTGQFATWLLGLVIFFDDYANTLVVGNTMRSITDKLKISREKLSYLVDSTAAPVAALAFITTWIGAELGYIQGGIEGLENFPEGQSAYGIFINSLGYSFYPIMTLAFMLMLIFTGRDFGPMLNAEVRARETGEVSRRDSSGSDEDTLKHFQPLKDIVPKSYNALIPILVLVVGVILGLFYTGHDPEVWNDESQGFFNKLSTIIGNSDSYAALLWASLSAVTIAILMTLAQGMMSLLRVMDTMIHGFKAMFAAIIILTLAWSLQGVTEDMQTAGFLTELLGNQLSPAWIPAIVFVLAAFISFSTGSSWGTMAIMYPLVLPLTWEVGMSQGLEAEATLPFLYNAVSAVLAGSVLGDHCSPISDTTILSSLACSCNHIDHVRTQLPYALTVGTVALVVGTIPSAFGFPIGLSFLLGLGILFAVVRFAGKLN
ncbi:MAG: Na+/H+ antiporter NhaC family protein [Bacteroidota bacterium]